MLFAGTDTTSGLLSHILQKLAQHPQWQEKLREEVREARSTPGAEIPYEELMELPLLNAICRETLRW